MKTTISCFLILLFTLSSCWLGRNTNGNKNFSKRKHLKGYFWNPRGGNGNIDRTNYASEQSPNEACEDQQLTVNSNALQHTKLTSEKQIISTDFEAAVIQEESDSKEEISNHEIDTELDDTVKVKNTSSYNDDWENYEMYQPRCGFGWPIIFIPIIIYTGLFFLLLYLILAAFDIVLKWILVTGVIMAGLPIAILLLIITLAVIFY